MKYSFLAVIFILSLNTESISVKLTPETGNPPKARKLAAMTHDSIDQKLYIFGGVSDSKLNDMWEFDLETKLWAELHVVSELRPGPRSGSYLLRLRDKPNILLFGGDTPYGPISDLWVYDIEYQTVNYMQWKILEYLGKPPPRAYYRAICAFSHESKNYMAVYGGANKDNFEKSLYL